MEESQFLDLPEEGEAVQVVGSKTWPIWLLFLLVLAFALRILLLDEQSIWWDEGISLHLGVSPLAVIMADRLSNIHPPLYFILLKGWLLLVGVTAFTARYFSVLASWLQVVVVYSIARRWFGRRTAAGAILFAALSAVSILYAQEIRVYAMLALIYLLLMAETRELTRQAGAASGRRTGLWIALGLTTWVGLHLHYMVFIVAVYVSAWALFIYFRQRRWPEFRRWLLVMYLVGLASLPWFGAVLRNWANVRSEAVAGTFATEPVPITFLLRQVWVFHLTGLAGALARPGVGTLVTVVGMVLLLLVLWRLGQKGTRRDTAALLAHWLVPLSSALIVWMVRSFSHPRYVSMFAPGLTLLIAYVAFPPREKIGERLRWFGRLISLILTLGVIAISLMGLWLYFVDPDVAKDDVRGVARYLENEADAADLILIPDTDYSLPFEYQGEAVITMPGLDDLESKWPNLAALSTGIQRIFWVDYEQGTRDWQGLLPFALGKAGTITMEKDFDGLVVQSYVLDEELQAPTLDPQDARFDPLRLTGSWIEQDGFAGNGLALALRWQLVQGMGENAQVSLRLLDEAGWSFAQQDTVLVDALGRPSRYWPIGEPVITYHVLAIPPATPPLAYDLQMQVYVDNGGELKTLDLLDDQGARQGQTSVIGKTHVTYKADAVVSSPDDLPIDLWDEPVQLAPALALLGAELGTNTVKPGQSVDVQLLWQATADLMPDLRPEVILLQGNKEMAVNNDGPALDRYPVDIWRNGEQVFEHRDLLVPPDASGAAQVLLRLNDELLSLGDVMIESSDHSFIPPEREYVMDDDFGDMARLAGFDLPETTFTFGEAIPVTLIWESLTDGAAIDYAVFVHLLAEDGHVIAQHDGSPASGSRPTSGWVSGEYISDTHDIAFHEEAYQGPARIAIGMYDPATGERLQLSDGLDQLILPVILTIERP